MSILKDKTLWATNASYLNDAQELVFAYSLLEQVLEARMQRLPSSSLIHVTAEYLLKHLKVTQVVTRTYLVCFSARFDDLNQWRSYCGGGNGYMIGFDVEALAMHPSISRTWKLVECVYGRQKQEQKISDLLDVFEESLEGVFPFFGRGEVNEGFADRAAVIWATRFAREIAPTFKHPAFADEAE